MKKFVILISFVVFLFQNKASSQDVPYDSIQIERIAKTCQLWGHLKYFHPYLGADSIDWENAFTENIEGIITAKSSNEFQTSLQKMLDCLNDPVTSVVNTIKVESPDDSIKYPKISFIDDSVLFISVKDYNDLQDFNFSRSQFLSFREKIPQSSGVIFDLRSDKPLGDVNGYLSGYLAEMESFFSIEKLFMHGLKARFYDGFSEEERTSGIYQSEYYVTGEKVITPASDAVDKSYVFIANNNSELPMVALALQTIGKAKIISTEELTDSFFVNTVDFEMDASFHVSMRENVLQQNVNLKADYIVDSGISESDLISMAINLLKSQIITLPTAREENIPSTSGTLLNKVDHTNNTFPDLSHRLLAIARIWTVIHYFHAYQDLMEDDWEEVLKEFIPKIAAAKDSLEYHLTVAEMYQHIQDGHGYINSPVLSDYFGTASPPIKVRNIQNKWVVVGILPDSVFQVNEVKVGDIIVSINDVLSEEKYDRLSKYISSSNDSWLKNSVSHLILNGRDSTTIELKIQKEEGGIHTVILPVYNSYTNKIQQLGNDRNQEPITRLINDKIGYADLDRLTNDMVDKMFSDFKDTKAIIFDMRGYPNGTAWSIAPHLTDKKNVYAAKIRMNTPMEPTEFSIGKVMRFTLINQTIPDPKFPTYTGKTVMLIDERTISQAEHTGLFLEAANGTEFIGSQTAGANGGVDIFQIPGKITLYFSGGNIRHYDGRQLQKIGLEPNITVKPTIKGIREGRDEVLEKAINYLEDIIDQ